MSNKSQKSVSLDACYNERRSNKDLYDMIDRRAKEILAGDSTYEFRKAVKEAEDKGDIRDLTERQIKVRMDDRHWRKVNQTIRKNEARHNTTDNGTDPSRER
jgi:hypothetical protein